MKSKAEIITALERCNDFENHCIECPYDNKNSRAECVDELFNDIITLLSKSDFEVLSEIISRGKRYDFECYEGPKGLMWIKLQNPEARDCLPVNIRFDKKGNIL